MTADYAWATTDISWCSLPIPSIILCSVLGTSKTSLNLVSYNGPFVYQNPHSSQLRYHLDIR